METLSKKSWNFANIEDTPAIKEQERIMNDLPDGGINDEISDNKKVLEKYPKLGLRFDLDIDTHAKLKNYLLSVYKDTGKKLTLQNFLSNLVVDFLNKNDI